MFAKIKTQSARQFHSKNLHIHTHLIERQKEEEEKIETTLKTENNNG